MTMMSKIDTTWDINKYKSNYELDHEWILKKKFMLAHKDKYSEDRLISLAQIFSNIHFLGCKYADPVMELVDSLSKGIIEKNEKWEHQSFVSASSAVEERVKAQINRGEHKSMPTRGPINFVRSDDLSLPSSSKQHSEDIRNKGDVWIRGQKRPASNPEECRDEFTPHPYKRGRTMAWDQQTVQAVPSTSYAFEHKRNQFNIRRVVESGPFGKVVVFQSAITKEESPISIVERSASAAHMTTSFDYSNQMDGIDCKLSLDGLYLATGRGRNQKAAKECACRVAIERLKETSFTIVVKALFVGSESVDRKFNSENNQKKESANVDTPIADSNIGSKMLKLMGWLGGGLGKNEQGIEEPLKPYDCNVRRGGLGISNFSDFKRKIGRIIEDFSNRDSKEDLVFSPEFNKEERKVIHELVRKYNLKSRSFGKEENNRRLVVFKKIRPLEIVEDLMNCGGETEKYNLIAPQAITFS